MPPLEWDTFTSVKHFAVALQAGASPVNLLADNPRRNFLVIINNGANAGSFWFDQAKNTGQAVNLGPGASWPPSGLMKVPINRVFVQSAAGTTFAVIEGYDRGGG